MHNVTLPRFICGETLPAVADDRLPPPSNAFQSQIYSRNVRGRNVAVGIVWVMGDPGVGFDAVEPVYILVGTL
jgi:hypothetical protein